VSSRDANILLLYSISTMVETPVLKHGLISYDCMQVKGAMKPQKRKEIKDTERAMGLWNQVITCLAIPSPLPHCKYFISNYGGGRAYTMRPER